MLMRFPSVKWLVGGALLLVSIGLVAVSFTDDCLEMGRYQYQVRTHTNAGTGPWSELSLVELVLAPLGSQCRSGEVVNRAVLPKVLRSMTDTIHQSIYERIRERQIRDGFWKP